MADVYEEAARTRQCVLSGVPERYVKDSKSSPGMKTVAFYDSMSSNRCGYVDVEASCIREDTNDYKGSSKAVLLDPDKMYTVREKGLQKADGTCDTYACRMTGREICSVDEAMVHRNCMPSGIESRQRTLVTETAVSKRQESSQPKSGLSGFMSRFTRRIRGEEPKGRKVPDLSRMQAVDGRDYQIGE